MNAPVATAELVLEQIDLLLGAVDVDLELDRECLVDAILATAVTDAAAFIRDDQPGRARFVLEAGRLRAQHILDGGAR